MFIFNLPLTQLDYVNNPRVDTYNCNLVTSRSLNAINQKKKKKKNK